MLTDPTYCFDKNHKAKEFLKQNSKKLYLTITLLKKNMDRSISVHYKKNLFKITGCR